MADLSRVVPTLAHIYPSGKADINQFQAAGGSLAVPGAIDGGPAAQRMCKPSPVPACRATARKPYLHNGELAWRDGPQASLDSDVLRPVSTPLPPMAACACLTAS
ncbi:dihydroxy-acid dehydratase [Halopseudomonas pachastrellae]|nr:dihydroxy-acid dehydratase [Halopseudomonas pachastrellae]